VTETALVLCGGRSTRMGRDKASLPFGGDTLVTRVVEILRGVVPDVVLVAREGQAVPDGVAVVRDPAEGLGPLAAIAAGLASLRTDRAFVAPCDVPLLVPALVRRLLEEAGTSLACVPRIEGRAMPVCAVYRREVAAVASALVAGGERRAQALLGHVETRYVEGEALRAVDPTLASFLDCDTPEAYEAALEAAGLADAPAGRRPGAAPSRATGRRRRLVVR
jgi:molybdopterin-guanine dinucleotide biosynthesis protein A